MAYAEPAPSDAGWRDHARRRFGALTIAWALAVIVTWTTAALVGQRPVVNGEQRASTPRSAVDVLSAWDGNIYRGIATDGYQVEGNDRRYFVFFPLYPALARLVGGRSHAALGGIVVSQLAMLAAMFLLSIFARRPGADRLIQDPALWMLAAPMGFFFLAMYSESLFVLLTVGAALAFSRSKFGITIALAFLAGLTRPTAITFCVPFVWAAWELWRRGGPWKAALACAAAPLAGIAVYVIGVGVVLGDAAAYTSLRTDQWKYELAIPFMTTFRDAYDVAYGLRHGTLAPEWQIARLATFGVTAAVIALYWKRIPGPWLAYLLVSLAFVHASNPAGSSARYEVVLFPTFMLLAASALARPKLGYVVLALSAAAQVFLLVRFGQWVWIS